MLSSLIELKLSSTIKELVLTTNTTPSLLGRVFLESLLYIKYYLISVKKFVNRYRQCIFTKASPTTLATYLSSYIIVNQSLLENNDNIEHEFHLFIGVSLRPRVIIRAIFVPQVL